MTHLKVGRRSCSSLWQRARVSAQLSSIRQWNSLHTRPHTNHVIIVQETLVNLLADQRPHQAWLGANGRLTYAELVLIGFSGLWQMNIGHDSGAVASFESWQVARLRLTRPAARTRMSSTQILRPSRIKPNSRRYDCSKACRGGMVSHASTRESASWTTLKGYYAL